MADDRPTPLLDWALMATLAIVLAWSAHASSPYWIGQIGDDACYALYGRALAEGQGYVNTALPDNPPASHFPIGFPALVALVLLGVGPDVGAQVDRLLWVGPIALGLFAAITYYYMRRQAALPWALAFGMAVAIGTNPGVRTWGEMLASDLPAGCILLVGLILLERAGHAGDAKPTRWLAGGALLGGAVLMRYAAIAALPAVGLVLLLQRRFVGAFWAGVGFAAALGPWLLYRVGRGGENYQFEVASIFQHSLAEVPGIAFGVVRQLMEAVVPVLTTPGWFPAHTRTAGLAGFAIAILMLLGVLAHRKREDARDVLAMPVMVLILASVLVWQTAHPHLGAELPVRLLVPVAPFMLLAAGYGLRAIWPASLARFGMPLALAAVLAIAGTGTYEAAKLVADPGYKTIRENDAQAYAKLWGFLATLPPAVRLTAYENRMIAFYTRRKCVRPPDRISYPIVEWLVAGKFTHIVGTPVTLIAPEEDPAALAKGHRTIIDLSKVMINRVSREAPGMLTPLYFGEGGQLAVFAISQPK